MSGAESRKSSDAADDTGHNQQIPRPMHHVDQRLAGKRPRRPQVVDGVTIGVAHGLLRFRPIPPFLPITRHYHQR
ncbi:Uncharacterised protein [Mycobacterium tuberculosis]|uniref:Uncharacterized protein n=1 Tax=Mycobacterium tuberculosis TaxID=1773 RepID=A0A916LF36_MYCTX|nr:Uncharacterised protein [Mycobacterium tuberculosis]COZ87391.1 Uncharacterised protein [Mycobacterium tuberculosis]COZ93942.1 Uncharacterised protein [Mycobacterium tuberculosis]